MNYEVSGPGTDRALVLTQVDAGPDGWSTFALRLEGGPPQTARARRAGPGAIELEWHGRVRRVLVSPLPARGASARSFEVVVGSESFRLQVTRGGTGGSARRTAKGAGPVHVSTTLPGRVVAIHVKPGSAVRKGQLLATLEAMKMQNEFVAPVDGVVREVRAREGTVAAAGDVLAILEPHGEETAR